jgi:VIT1/CCC1 family predicted Fe2+/Mn2+ transporter
MQSLSLLGVAAVVLAIPLFIVGAILSRLSNDPEPKRFAEYLLLPPTD